ncbi:MAG: DNA-3-methyladenine glycosylase 2 family protein [Cyanobacteria bacterium P01_D01_bin.36]
MTEQAASERNIHEQLIAIACDISTALTASIEKNGPIELNPAQDSPFAEHLCRAVTGQQLSVKAAASIWKRVTGSVPEDMALINHILSVEPDVLRGCGLSRAKVKTVVAIAQSASQGELNSAELAALTHPERTKRLTALWGIGQWTADMMSIFYFGDPDIWPEGDLAARKTLEQLTSKRRKTLRTAARFAPYRSYLALHMWQHVDAAPNKS